MALYSIASSASASKIGSRLIVLLGGSFCASVSGDPDVEVPVKDAQRPQILASSIKQTPFGIALGSHE
jgi:hypothetical protein